MMLALELAMLVAAYLLAAIAPDWRWWGGILAACAGLTAFVLWNLTSLSAPGSPGIRLLPLVIPAIAGASGGLVARAVTLLLRASTPLWALATGIGLVATGALAWAVF